MKKEAYPKYNKEKLDKLNQMRFRKYKALISNAIYMADDALSSRLSSEEIETLAWNSAYEILTQI